MIYLFTLILLLAMVALSFHRYYYKVFPGTDGYYSRIERDGGSIFFSKILMNYGYWVLQPFADLLIRLRVTPNHITFLSLGLAFLAGMAVYQNYFFLAGILCGVSSILDAVDGMVARKSETSSLSGSVLDSTVDRVSEFFIGFGLVLVYRKTSYSLIPCFTLLLGSMLVSYASAKAEIFKLNPPRGIMRRGERALYLTLAFLFAPTLAYLFDMPGLQKGVVITTLYFVGPLSIYSAVRRNFWMYKELSKQDNNILNDE